MTDPSWLFTQPLRCWSDGCGERTAHLLSGWLPSRGTVVIVACSEHRGRLDQLVAADDRLRLRAVDACDVCDRPAAQVCGDLRSIVDGEISVLCDECAVERGVEVVV